MARVIWITAALLIEYTPISGSGFMPAIEAILMIRCHGIFAGSDAALARATILRPTAWATKKAPRRFVSITNS